MALNDMTFTNSVGSFTLSRVMYSLSHSYQWDGTGPAKLVVRIDITGRLKTTESNLEDICGENGDSGVLQLPHETYSSMNVVSLSHEDGTWSKWGTVSVSFSDENASERLEKYSLTWYGFTLYNPRVSVTPSVIKRSTTKIHGIEGWQTQQLGHSTFTVSLSGTLPVPGVVMPSGFMDTLEKHYGNSDPYPSGYPLVFDLIDAVPESTGNFEIEKLIVTDAQASWNFEQHFADVTINMIAPPQEIV